MHRAWLGSDISILCHWFDSTGNLHESPALYRFGSRVQSFGRRYFGYRGAFCLGEWHHHRMEPKVTNKMTVTRHNQKWFACLLFHILTTSKIMSGRVPRCEIKCTSNNYPTHIFVNMHRIPEDEEISLIQSSMCTYPRQCNYSITVSQNRSMNINKWSLPIPQHILIH